MWNAVIQAGEGLLLQSAGYDGEDLLVVSAADYFLFADDWGVSKHEHFRSRIGVNLARRGLSVGWSGRGRPDRVDLLLSRTPELALR
jgi:hypothetical protein